jgi:hypothetical protein
VPIGSTTPPSAAVGSVVGRPSASAPPGARSLKENPLFTVFLPDNPKAERILTLFEDKNNRVRVGTSDGLYRLVEAGGRTALEAAPPGKPLHGTIYVNEILGDRRGALWIGTANDGLLRLSADGGVRRLTTEGGFVSNIVETREERAMLLIWLKVKPRHDASRSDPRFQELLRKLNLAP